MVRPEPKPAIAKAPSREHPAAPLQSVDRSSPAAPAEETTELFSTRLRPSTRRRLKMYAASSGDLIQAITEQAVVEFLDRKEDPTTGTT